MLYVAPTGSTDPNAPYVGKDVAAGKQGSKVPPRAVEGPLREIMAVITAAQALGLDAPSGTDLAQMLKAVRSGLLGYAVGTGSPDAIVIAPQPIYTVLLPGMRFRVKIPGTAPSTTVNPTLTVNGISAPIRLRGGGAPAVGDVVNGAILTFDIDDAGNARFVTSAPSEITGTTTITNVLNAKKIAGGQPYPYATAGNYQLSIAKGTTFSVGECRGAGGGGGGAAGTSSAAGGGGGGGNGRKVATATVDTVLAIVVGASGQPGAAGGGNGSSGGTTSVSVLSGSVTDVAGKTISAGQTLCAATGGAGGQGSSSGTATQGAPGGVASGGDLNDNGDGGGLPQGQYSNATYLGGLGGSSPGSGGSPSGNQGAAGNASAAAGVGGNGASNNAPGGAGAPGRVIVYQ